MGLASAGGEGCGGGALLIRTPHLQVTDLQSCRGDHQHRTSPHGSLWNPAETRRENTEGKKKQKTSTKPGAKDGGRNFVQLRQSHMSPPERSSTVRVPPGPTQPRGTRAQRGAERSRAAPGAHAAPFAAGVPNGPRGCGYPHSRRFTDPFPHSPVAAERSQKSFSRKTNPLDHLFFTHR